MYTRVAWILYLASLYIACVWSVHVCVYTRVGLGALIRYLFVPSLVFVCFVYVRRILSLGRRKGSLASLWRQWIL